MITRGMKREEEETMDSNDDYKSDFIFDTVPKPAPSDEILKHRKYMLKKKKVSGRPFSTGGHKGWHTAGGI